MGFASWIPIEVDLPDHPKVADLENELGETTVEAYLIRVWCWAARLAPDGVTRGVSAECSVERAARWRGNSGVLVAALVKTGWLERSEDGLRLHNWEERAGKFLKKAEAERARWRERNSRRSTRGVHAESPRHKEKEKEKEKDTREAQEASARVRAPVQDQGVVQSQTKDQKPTANPRHKPVVDLLVLSFTEELGTPYHFAGAKDGTAVRTLLTYPEATDEEIRRRVGVHLADDFNRKRAGVAWFVSRWTSAGAVQPAGKGPVPAQKAKPEDHAPWTGDPNESGFRT